MTAGTPSLGGLVRVLSPALALKSVTKVLFGGSTSGTATLQAPSVAGSAVITLPGVTSTVATLAGTETLSNKTIPGAIYSGDITRCTSALTANNSSTYASITGLSQTVVAGTYKFKCVLPSTVANGTGGIKYCFKYTTTVVSSIEATGLGYTSSAVAVQHTTTKTDQADLFSQAAVVIMTIIEGTMVVGTGGTIAMQMAQNTANASNTVTLVGASMKFTRIS